MLGLIMNEQEFLQKKEQFENELRSFFDNDRMIIKTNSERLCHFFELACYSRFVEYYRSQNFKLKCHLKNNENVFRFKATTQGKPNKYSYFRISQNASVTEGESRKYDVRANMPVKSFFDNCKYTPDIVVSLFSDDEDIKVIENQNLVTFCEVKYLKPHPEMLANFIGLLHEITPNLLSGPEICPGLHPAPSLIASGRSSENVNDIVTGMLNRYTVNFALNYENNSEGLVPSKRIHEQ